MGKLALLACIFGAVLMIETKGNPIEDRELEHLIVRALSLESLDERLDKIEDNVQELNHVEIGTVTCKRPYEKIVVSFKNSYDFKPRVFASLRRARWFEDKDSGFRVGVSRVKTASFQLTCEVFGGDDNQIRDLKVNWVAIPAPTPSE